jgi:hypothetical protein
MKPSVSHKQTGHQPRRESSRISCGDYELSSLKHSTPLFAEVRRVFQVLPFVKQSGFRERNVIVGADGASIYTAVVFRAALRQLNVHLDKGDEGDFIDAEIMDARKVGIADGWHTFAVISDTIDRIDALKAVEDWTEPYVRVRFMTSKAAFVVPEEMVEALNTSTQVKEHTMDEYRNEFQPLKDILSKSGFDISNISFQENDPGTWDIRLILQRLGCFLKDKPEPRLHYPPPSRPGGSIALSRCFQGAAAG